MRSLLCSHCYGTLLRTALLTSVFLALGGCASVDSEPFVAFSASVEALRSGSQSHTQSAVSDSREQLIKAVRGGELNPADLQLEFTGPFDTRYGFADNEPTYIRYERFRNGLVALNSALGAYAQTLVLLAGGSDKGDILPSQEQFDQMTRDLNANALRASATLGLSGNGDQGALLTTAAIQLFKVYLAHSRQQSLEAAIREVQPQIVDFSKLAEQVVRILAGQVETDYKAEFLPIALASPPKAEPLLRLNRLTRARLAALKSIFDSYRVLPRAHRDLALASARKPGLLAGLTALNRETGRLMGLLEALKRTSATAQSATRR